MPKKLMLFVDPSWRRDGVVHSPLLFPFWGNGLIKEKTPFQWQMFERHTFDTTYYGITDDVAAADMIFMPYSHNHAVLFAPDVLDLCVKKSAVSTKPLLIDGVGDIEREVAIPNAYVIRYGGYIFAKQDNEIQVPPYADDLLEVYCEGIPVLRHKSAVSTVSFAGWGSLTLWQTLRAVVKELPDRLHGLIDSRYLAKKKGVFFRQAAVELLKQSNEVRANLLVRRSYSGNSRTAEKGQEELRREFVQNLLESDYSLDIRGDANASIRLFEILALGRIPVIVNTERNLPFSDAVDYKTFALIVDFRDLKHLAQRIADFNASITDEQFIEMQKAARDAYIHFFRVDALTKHLVTEIWSKLGKQSLA